MSNISWTYELRMRMYKKLLADLGSNPLHFNSRGKPHSMSKSEWINYLDGVAITLGLASNKGGALSNQIAWVFCTPSAKCHKGHFNNMIRNRTAANLAGWVLHGSPVPTKPSVTTVVQSKSTMMSIVVKVAAIVGTGLALAMGVPIIL